MYSMWVDVVLLILFPVLPQQSICLHFMLRVLLVKFVFDKGNIVTNNMFVMNCGFINVLFDTEIKSLYVVSMQLIFCAYRIMCRNFFVRWALVLYQVLWHLVSIYHLMLQKVGFKDHNQLQEKLNIGQRWAQWLLYIEKKGMFYTHSLFLFWKSFPVQWQLRWERVVTNVTISTDITLHLCTFADFLLSVLGDNRVQ